MGNVPRGGGLAKGACGLGAPGGRVSVAGVWLGPGVAAGAGWVAQPGAAGVPPAPTRAAPAARLPEGGPVGPLGQVARAGPGWANRSPLPLGGWGCPGGSASPLFSDTGCLRMACLRGGFPARPPSRPHTQPPSHHPTPPVTPSAPRLPLCRTSKFYPWFCTHTAHDGPPVRSDSLSGVISAIARGGIGAPALRPATTDDIRDRAAVAGLRGREGGVRAPGTSSTPRARTSQRAASHPLGSSRLAHISPLISPRGIASNKTGHPASRRYTGGEETVLPSTSRNGARQEPEDNADQAGRSQGRAA